MSWFNNPAELFRADKITSFWPTNTQTPDERINASTRFILYLSCILYLIKRDIRIMVLALLMIAVLYFCYKNGFIKSGIPVFDTNTTCQSPTEENPMANVMMDDYAVQPDRASACWYPSVETDVKKWVDNTFYFDAGRSRSPWPQNQRNAAARQFFSNPVTQIPGDQTAFAEWCYGKKFRPMCRDGGVCDPDYWGAQTEAFSGLDYAGNKRSGMSAR